jgi:hypothetical protein
MAYALRAYVTALKAGEVSHDGDLRLVSHIANARRRPTRLRDDQGQFLWLMQKEHPTSANKIDAAMAAVLSWTARGDAIAAGATNNRSVYEERGLLVL